VISRPAARYAKEAALCFLLPIVALAVTLWCFAILLKVIVQDLRRQRAVGARLISRVENFSPLLHDRKATRKLLPFPGAVSRVRWLRSNLGRGQR
jgi:hypothetical protein